MSSKTVLDRFFKTAELRTYKRGVIILDGKDSSDDHIYYVKEGFVKVYALNLRGQKYIHVIYGPGDAFPLAWIINNISRNVYYKSMSQSEIYVMHRKDFLRSLKSDPKLSFAFLQQSVDQFRIYAERVHNLEYTYSSERIAYRILWLSQRFGNKLESGKVVLNVPASHQIIADSINLSREVVTREINRLIDKNILEYDGKSIVIRDRLLLAKQFNTSVSFESGFQSQSEAKTSKK